jgi:hypothetical protein
MWNVRQLVVLAFCGLFCLTGGAMFVDEKGADPADAEPAAFVQENSDYNLIKLDSATKSAIDDGLAYLAKSQHVNGSFGTGAQHGSIAVTSLAGLAFMAGGHQPGRGKYGKEVTRAVEYVIRQEGARGFLQPNPQGQMYGPMYGHGFGTLFLAEIHGMIQNPKLRDEVRGTLKRAVTCIIESQNHEGGWRYQPRPFDADLSVTICQIMALRAARNAGITVPKSVVDNCLKYVRECQDLGTGGFRYQRFVGPPGFARTAAGVVALNSAGKYLENKDADGEAVQKGLDYLKQFQPGNNRGRFDNTETRIHYFYGHYYAAQAMWLAGGNHWKTWYPAIRNDLVSKAGSNFRQEDGSWSDRQFCPHYCTAMALIILQIPNNYLPIMQR